MKKISSYEIEQINQIKKWENMEPSIITRGTEFFLKPLSWTLGKIVPTKVIEGIMSTCNAAGSLFADKGDILRDAEVKEISELRSKNLELSDKLADEVHNWAIGVAIAEGGATGSGGAFTILIDIPALITLAYRTMHKIGLCYGYECNTPEERMFINMILSAASSNTVKEKTVALIGIKQIEVIIAKQTWKKIGNIAAANKIGPEALIVFIRSFAKTLNKNLTRRKALQAIPYIGAVVGASMNGSFIQDVAWAARRSFQRRWLKENEKIELENN